MIWDKWGSRKGYHFLRQGFRVWFAPFSTRICTWKGGISVSFHTCLYNHFHLLERGWWYEYRGTMYDDSRNFYQIAHDAQRCVSSAKTSLISLVKQWNNSIILNICEILVTTSKTVVLVTCSYLVPYIWSLLHLSFIRSSSFSGHCALRTAITFLSTFVRLFYHLALIGK